MVPSPCNSNWGVGEGTSRQIAWSLSCRRFDHAWFSRRRAALIIVPPFAALDKPALGAHLLQACARECGFEVSVLYANLALAAEIGQATYTNVAFSPTRQLLGERLFAAAAYGTPALGRDGDQVDPLRWAAGATLSSPMDVDDLHALEHLATRSIDDLAAAVAGLAFDVVGCTTTFQQTAASVALLSTIKRLRLETITILGGAN